MDTKKDPDELITVTLRRADWVEAVDALYTVHCEFDVCGADIEEFDAVFDEASNLLGLAVDNDTGNWMALPKQIIKQLG